MTIPELSEALMQLDEVTLLEVLGITSEDLVERFQDVIEEKADYLERQVEA